MKKLSIATTIVILGTGAAQADWSNVTGTITSIDKGKHQLMLNDGQTYSLRPDVKGDDLKVGARIIVSMEKQDGVNMVRSVSRTG
ncbi:MAG: DUF1344 domain-containing protein [Alphaproteobacteria bacterium]|nr:DUF1344 domain-containing protein [Alphaproteobacteria bacterium]